MCVGFFTSWFFFNTYEKLLYGNLLNMAIAVVCLLLLSLPLQKINVLDGGYAFTTRFFTPWEPTRCECAKMVILRSPMLSSLIRFFQSGHWYKFPEDIFSRFCFLITAPTDT